MNLKEELERRAQSEERLTGLVQPTPNPQTKYEALLAEALGLLNRAAQFAAEAKAAGTPVRPTGLLIQMTDRLVPGLVEAFGNTGLDGIRMQPNPHPHIPPETGLIPAEVAKVVPVPAGERRCWCRRTPEDCDGNWSERADRCPLHAEER